MATKVSPQLVMSPTAVFRQATVTVTARITAPAPPKYQAAIWASASPPLAAAANCPRLWAPTTVTSR